MDSPTVDFAKVRAAIARSERIREAATAVEARRTAHEPAASSLLCDGSGYHGHVSQWSAGGQSAQKPLGDVDDQGVPIKEVIRRAQVLLADGRDQKRAELAAALIDRKASEVGSAGCAHLDGTHL